MSNTASASGSWSRNMGRYIERTGRRSCTNAVTCSLRNTPSKNALFEPVGGVVSNKPAA